MNAEPLKRVTVFRAILKNFITSFDKYKNPTSCIADPGHVGTALLILNALSNILDKTILPAEQRSTLWCDTSEAFTSRISTGEVIRRRNVDIFTQLIISAHAADPEAETTKAGFKNLVSKIYEVKTPAVYSQLRTTLQEEMRADRLATIIKNIATLIHENLKDEEQIPIFLELAKAVRDHKSKSIRETKLLEYSDIYDMLDGYYVVACHQANLAKKKELTRANTIKYKSAE